MMCGGNILTGLLVKQAGPKQTWIMTTEDFRRSALACQGAVESAHMNHPDFRLNGKVFASLGYPDEEWGMIKLTPEQQRSFVEKEPEVFKPCNGTWGKRGCTNVHLASAGQKVVRAAMETAARNLTLPVAAGRKSKSKQKVKFGA